MTISQDTIAIIGAGTMGSGIAQKYATHGYRVYLMDQNAKNVEAAKNSIQLTLNHGVNRGIFTAEKAQEIMAQLSYGTELNGCRSASLIIEAIWEDLVAKKALFAELENHCSKYAIFATNTSSFLVREMQNGLKNPERVIGLHYFFHPAKNRLVELIAPQNTIPEYIIKAQNIQENINKTTISSADSPGFIVNRFFVPWLNEAMKIVYENESNIATVEHAAKHFFNIAMGPFELMNITGLPITLHACQSMAKSLGPFYAPCPLILMHLEKKNLFDLAGNVDESKLTTIGQRLLNVVHAITAKMVFDEKVCKESDVDLGAKVGLLWKKGPFELTHLI